MPHPAHRLRLGLAGPTFCACLAVVSPAAGQSFHLESGSLESQGNPVAHLGQAPVRVEWRPGNQAFVRFEDDTLRVAGTILARGSDDRLLVGVGADAALMSRSGWRVSMLGGTWAPAVGGQGGLTEVALPRGFPVRSAWLKSGAPPAHSTPQLSMDAMDLAGLTASRGASAADRVEVAQHYCIERTSIGRHPWDPHPWSRPDYAEEGEFLSFAPGNKQWGRLLFASRGFAMEGYARVWREPHICTVGRVGLGLEGGMGCGDGQLNGWQVWLDAGTLLYARPWRPGLRPFAEIRRRIRAIEVAPRRGRVDPNAVPSTVFLVEHEEGGASVRLNGYLSLTYGELGVDGSAPWTSVAET